LSKIGDTFTFSGTEKEKSEVKTVSFTNSPKLEFIPTSIFDEFPALNGLKIEATKIPILKSGLFTSKFKKIEYLELLGIDLETIEVDALKELTELKFFFVGGNPETLQSLNYPIFKWNPKLESISVTANNIQRVNPHIFDGLNFLNHINFQYTKNRCYKKNLTCRDRDMRHMCHCYRGDKESRRKEICSFNKSDIDSEFATCFANCREDPICSKQIN
jgi:hypothetical protein